MVINQIAAIGDLLFLEPMYRHYWRLTGNKPVVPVRDHLFWIADYIESATFVRMSQFNMDYENRVPSEIYLPTRWANELVRNINEGDYSLHEFGMPDKYTLAKLDPEMWIGLNINFNLKKGLELFNKLGLKGQEYILVNNHSQAGIINIHPKTNFKIVAMRSMPGYTVLDWFYVMLHAKENHHVSTSTFYIFQSIKNQFVFETPVYIYARPNFDGLRGVAKLKPTYNIKRCE